MRRSELAKSAGCHPETVRFYEARGLLPAPPRTAAGHRVYGPEDAHRLRFVVRARELGFSLDQIKALLRLTASTGSVCADARTIARARLEEIRRAIADLGRLEQALAAMVARCREAGSCECPIIDALAQGGSGAPTAHRPRISAPGLRSARLRAAAPARP